VACDDLPGINGWLVTVAWRKFLDAYARRKPLDGQRRGRVETEPRRAGEPVDDTLQPCTPLRAPIF